MLLETNKQKPLCSEPQLLERTEVSRESQQEKKLDLEGDLKEKFCSLTDLSLR